MEKERSHMTEQILDLTLEIVYLLTGENYIAFKLSDGLVGSNLKNQRPAMEPPSHPRSKNKRKVQEVTSKIIDLLMGEVTVDVNPIDCITEVTEEEDPYVMGIELCEEEEIPPEFNTDPGDTRDPQRDVKAEEEEEEEHVRIKVEEILPEISTDEPHNMNNTEKFTFIAEDGKTKDDEIICKVNSITQNFHLVVPSADLLSNPFTHEGSFPDLCPPSHHTFCSGGDALPPSDRGEHFTQREDLTSPPMSSTEDKPYSCSQCGKCFTRRAYLSKHQRIHVGLTPFSCSECGKCFTRRTSLINHQRTHTGVKPYSCPDCGKCFTWRTTFIEHQRSHTGVRPYSCSVCGKCFSLYSAFSKHQKIHTGEKPYSCAECGRHFTRSDHLLIHQRTHTGEKPYSCAECGKRFNERARLLTHQVVHTGIHPYSCSVCGKGFITNSRLVKHQQVHLSLEPHAWAE